MGREESGEGECSAGSAEARLRLLTHSGRLSPDLLPCGAPKRGLGAPQARLGSLEDDTGPGSPRHPCAPACHLLHGLGTTRGPDQQGPPEHLVMAARMEFLSRQNQLNGAHSPHACVCVCTCVGSHAARKEKGRAHKLWSVPTALPRPQPRGAHTGPGALLAQTHAHATRCPTAPSGLLVHRQP